MKSRFLAILILATACGRKSSEVTFPTPGVAPTVSENTIVGLSREEYYDKVLGMLVGSAIGDAMGAPTEMWDRKSIRIHKHYVDSLDGLVGAHSPEGQWQTNMPGGSTTDDTRWKYLITGFLITQSPDTLNPSDLAKNILKVYDLELRALKVGPSDYPTINQNFSHLNWLIEWVKVAKPFADNDMYTYQHALNKFYGGEMTCAGMLYAPVVGAYFPGKPYKAYSQAYALSLFDIGYARDITSLTAAYVSKAMERDVNFSEITKITGEVDPQDYANSRLVGRLAYKAYKTAQSISFQAHAMREKEIPADIVIPDGFKHSALDYAQQQRAYELLEDQLQQIPFHAGEIHLINLTAIEFSKGDFTRALEFVSNFGRDNDTVGAVTGSILGAMWGFKKLPAHMTRIAIDVNRNIVGIDLEQLAQKLVDHRYPKN